jgi:DNA-directed RNA polymerase subunit E'/Rpb7
MSFKETRLYLDIYLNPKEIQENMFSVIKNKVKWKYEDKCIKDIGYINRINKIRKIIKDEIRNIDVSLYLVLEVIADVYNPKQYDIIDMNIKKVLPYGFYLENSEKKIKGLLRENTKDTNVDIGESIKVMIKDIRFETQYYQAIVQKIED